VPGQPLTPRRDAFARAAALATFAIVAPAASAQYSISAAGTPSGPGTCGPGTATVPMNGGTLTLVLPPPPNNVYFSSSVNGGAAVTASTTNASSVVPEPSFGFEISPPTLPPYTAVQSFFPAVAGVPSGTGVIFTISCTAGGAASVSWVNGAAPPGAGGGSSGSASTAAVPALSWPGLAASIAAIAWIAAVSFRRRRSNACANR
jgi:hypothetical protein